MSMARHAAIIGGGISGLASAWRIAARGYRTSLFESQDFLGGLGTTFPYREGHLERFYHCILPSDLALIGLIRELGLGDDLLWRKTRMGFMYQKRTYPLNTAMDLLCFSPLTFVERLRMGLMGIRTRISGLNPDLDNVTAADWIRGMVGERAFNILWKPLLSAKIGDHYPALPALWLSSRMNREKNVKTEVKGCLRMGYFSLIKAFETRLRERGVEIYLKESIDAIEQDGTGMVLKLRDGQRRTFDLVVSTLPLPQFQRATRSLDLPKSLSGLTLDYQGVISAVFLLKHPLSEYYWTPWVDSNTTAQGAIEMSNLVPLERSQGLYITYLVNYAHRDSEFFGKSDAELLSLYRADLAGLYPGICDGIVDEFVFRAPYVEPIWTVGYSRRRPPTTVIPGRLFLACTAQVYPRVNSWNSACEVVEEMVAGLGSEVPSSASSPRG